MAAEGEATLAFCSSPPVRHSGLRSNVVPPRVSHVGRRLRAAHRARPSLRPRAVAAEPKTGTPAAVQRTFETFTWRGYSINYRDLGQRDAPPLLLVHGFGASVMHWRKNVDVLAAAGFRVFAIDLLGFGASSKPNLGKGKYRLELWRDLVVDFIRAIDAAAAVSRPWKLCGNSIGSLVSMMAAIELGADRVDGLSLLNCAGGLTSFRLSELNPVAAFLFVCFNTLLFNRFTGPAFFDRFSTRENVRSVLDQAYAGGRDAVSDRLVTILVQPAEDEGAAQVFLACLNGPPGPTPEDLLSSLHWCPVLVCWGEDDPFTPWARGAHPGVNFPEFHPTLQLQNLGSVGHCPHDSAPDSWHRHMLQFLNDPVNYRAAPLDAQSSSR